MRNSTKKQKGKIKLEAFTLAVREHSAPGPQSIAYSLQSAHAYIM